MMAGAPNIVDDSSQFHSASLPEPQDRIRILLVA